jgi:hypothetical protein
MKRDPCIKGLFFLILGAHMNGAEFQYPDNKWQELVEPLRIRLVRECKKSPPFREGLG